MKTPLVAGIVILVLILGAWLYSNASPQQPSPQAPGDTNVTVENNGTPNQANQGQPDTAVQPQPAPAPQASTTVAAQNLVLSMSTDVKLGAYLSSTNGMTVYTFDKDTKGVSNCSGACAVKWPPYTVASAKDIQLPAGMTGTVATMTRADGALQVTYNGKPLYNYSGDVKAGDTHGEGFNGIWHVAKP